MITTRREFIALTGASVFMIPAEGRGPATSLSSDLKAIVRRIPGETALYARSVLLDDAPIEINADSPFPAASIIKVAIMLTAYREVDDGAIRLAKRVPIRRHDVVGGSETFGAARDGQTATVSALLNAMIQQSDNTAANALTEYFGFDKINEVIARVGLRHTRLQRYFMYFSKEHENFTTASDLGKLLVGIARGARGVKQGFASRLSCVEMVRTMLGQEDREKIAPGLPNGTPLANKTGELPGVRHDAGIVDPFGNWPYVLIVLEKNLVDQQRGVRGINELSAAVYKQFKYRHGHPISR